MTLNITGGVTVITSSGSVVGGNIRGGLVTVFAGSFPQGPVFDPGNPTTCLKSSKQQALGTFGSDYSFNDLGGWSGPESVRIFYDEAEDNQPQVLILRAGTSQSTASYGTASSMTAALTLGGADGNGMTFVVAAPVGETQAITITPPVGNPYGAKPETYSVASGATWQAVQDLINPQSKLVQLDTAVADQSTAIASTLTTMTFASGAAGANATSSQINAAVDQLLNLTYRLQPVQVLVPLFSDTASSGVTLHALGNALSAQANGLRFQVIGSVDRSLGQGSAAVAGILTLANTLVPNENGGDSGRCSLLGNNYPYRIDPATGNERLYPPYVVAAAYAAKVAGLSPVSKPRSRHKFVSFTRFGEGYLPADLQTLYNGTGGTASQAGPGGVVTADALGMLTSEATTAIGSSYRRTNAVQTCEDLWTGDLANALNLMEVGTAAGAAAGQDIKNVSNQHLRGYTSANLMQSYALNVEQASSDARQWETDVQWNPILPVEGITLRSQLVVPPSGTVTVALAAV